MLAMLEVGRDRNGMRRNGDREDSREDKDADEEDQFASMNVADQQHHH